MTVAPAKLEGAIAFTDIVGFTEYTAIRGDAEAVILLSAQDRLVHEALPEGARIVKELGDGLLIWFTSAAGALQTCLDLQATFEEESARSGLPLWVRMGLHWGSPTARGRDLIGHDVNLASRIAGVAGPGEVILSEPAMVAAGPGLRDVEFEELGPVLLRGIPEPLPLYRASRR